MHFRLLGPLEVWDRGRGVELRRPKQRALLAILLLRARVPVSSDVLIDALWGESPPRTARAALQNYVAQLRRALGPGVLESSGGGYLLDVGPEQIDLGRFERLVAESREAEGAERVSKLQEALALWQGPPLAELAFEPFAAHEISRLEELRTSALEDLIDAQLALGADAELLDRLEALVAAHPFRERLRAQQMLALYRDGRQADALEVYQATRMTLVDELGIEPGTALRELEQAILRQDPSLEGPKRHAKEEEPPLEERRKVVTILFADVASFDTVDPELMRRTSVEALARMRTVLEAHGATIEQRAGDEVMAVFGVPLAHEDDALRAARAGLELQAEAGALSDFLEHSGRGRLEVRVGVATGEVLTGLDDTTYGFVAGPAITLAKRMLQAAGPDEVVAGAETLQRLGDTVVSDPMGDAGRLLELLEGDQTPARHLDAPLVGRRAELGALREAFARAVEERACRICLVVGEPGIGKTRLAAELTAALQQEAAFLVGHCVSYGKGATYLPLAEIFGEVERRQPLFELLAGDEHAELIAARLAGLAGEAQVAASGGETFWAVRRVLESLAAEQPLVLVFEDLHWAEPTLLDLIDYLASHVADAPVLLLGVARPELLETRPDWVDVDSVTLSPLSSEDAETLVVNLGALADSLREKVVRTAGGNPLFIEQLLAHASETGETESMPPSLEALLASRLDRLDAGELTVLQRAAVVGREFRLGAVVELVPRDEAAGVGKRLVGLSQKGLLEGDEAFRFRHVLIRDAAYATLPKAQRAELHERFGRWLESSRTGSEEVIGFHLEQAYRYGTELGLDGAGSRRLAAEAGGHLCTAGLRAARRGDMPAASSLLTRASSLLEPAEAARRDLLTELGLVRWRQGELSEAEQAFTRAIEIAVSERDRRAELRAHTELEYLRLNWSEEGASEGLLALAPEAIPVLEQAGDDRGLGRLWFALASISGSFFCQYRKSSEAAERALGYFRRSGWPLLPCLQAIAASLYYGPTPVPEAVRRCRELLQEADRGGTAQILLFLAGLEAMAGRFDSARTYAAQTRQIYEDLAWTVYVVTAHAPISAEIELLAGNYAEAERVLADSCRKLEELNVRGQLATQGSRLAEAIYAQGRHEEAIRWSKTAEAYAAPYDTGVQFLWRAIRGKALAREGALDEGERLAREAAELAATTDSVSQHAQTLLAYAEVLLLRGSREKAVEAVEEAVALLEAKGNAAAGTQARALLA
ncbi:MAG TPA: BTAD domain-containing putative transcriptional regulator [Gaiellaceae bacterium]|nr:BTAD domain-containing putative transcriptional regulator [Gaiellaceae bacterium]